MALVPTFIAKGPRAATPPGPYVLTDLGTLGGVSAQAADINDDGLVVGYASTATAGGHAFVWRNGMMTDLGTLMNGPSAAAAAINDLGQIVGGSTVALNTPGHATLWDNGQIIDLTPGSNGSSASGINNYRQVVGTFSNAVPFLWQNGELTILPPLGGGGGSASDINDTGTIVGTSNSTETSQLLGPLPRAVLWQKDSQGVFRVTNLGVIPGTDESGATAINAAGQIVGSSGHTDPDTYEVTSTAFLYSGGVMTALNVPSSEAYAGDINDFGVIVGSMRAAGGTSNFHAYVYADGVATNLNSLIPAGSGLHLSVAYGINNSGQIVGYAYDSRFTYHAFLLTPVDPGAAVINMGNVSVTEGHTGPTTATFNVSLSAAATQPVSVSYSTANGSATGGTDFADASGSVTFGVGETVKTVSVVVNGDRVGEPDETFLVNLSSATGGAFIADGQGVGTIVDDEPRVSITDVSQNEGNSGTKPFTFTVSLSAASTVSVSLNYATANGSAKAGEDYDAKSGALVFSAGQTSKTVSVDVRGDRKLEGQEVFYLNLSGATGAFLAKSQGTGVVRNDDR
jgi:probable HAF family extracellular repeat protein